MAAADAGSQGPRSIGVSRTTVLSVSSLAFCIANARLMSMVPFGVHDSGRIGRIERSDRATRLSKHGSARSRGVRVVQINEFKTRQTLEMLQSGIGDLSLFKEEILEVRQPAQVLQPLIRDLSFVQIENQKMCQRAQIGNRIQR